MSTENAELLRRYLNEQSEAAFTQLVAQNIDLVYSAALRQVDGDAGLAQEVTQNVFTDLARKVPKLAHHSSLVGWLYTSTRYLSSKARRSEQRRRSRELQAHAMNQPSQSPGPDPAWDDLRSVLDDAMHDLGPSDREAVLMRYFEGYPLAEIGTRLGLTENAARMRVDRAIEKLRVSLVKRGVTSSAAALTLMLTHRAVSAAPAGLAGQVGHAAFKAGTAPYGLVSGLLASLALSKTAIVAGGAALVLLAAGGFALRSRLHTLPAQAPSVTDASAAAAHPALNPATPAPTGEEDTAAPEAAPGVASSNQLVLHVVTADSGEPIPNVEFQPWIWGVDDQIRQKTYQASRAGICTIPVVRHRIARLILVSHSDGFADTRLEWQTDRGQTIPAEYALRLNRSVLIGGSVLDPDGKPIGGAKVSFGNSTDAAQEGVVPQTDNFGWPFHVTASTDAQGRWRIDRIGPEAMRTVQGVAQHPEYVESDRVSLQRTPGAEKELKQETYVFRLKPAAVVSGVVVDPDGKPVGEACVLVGHRGETGSRDATAAADGTFSVVGCRPGRRPVTAEAKGFAASTIEAEITSNSPPLRLTLQPARSLVLRVVNRSGQPVRGASVWLNTFDWNSPADANSKQAPQVEFNEKTDAEGRVRWESAPDQELSFDIAAAGYMRKDRVKLLPDGQEHTVTLSPGLTIFGTVRDATNNQPIPRFRIVSGWPSPDPVNHRTNFQWSTIDRFWLSFEGGTFRHTYEEPVISSSNPYDFVFKFEAEGYAAATTRVVGPDEGEVRFDIALQAAGKTAITVLLPDGRPAAGADIGLVSPGARLALKPGGFDRENLQSGGSLAKSDRQGQFQLAPDESVTRIVAAHPEGFAEATRAALEAEPTLRLVPWGRLEGVYRAAGRAAVGRELLFEYGQSHDRSVHSSFDAYRVKTDAQGRFVFPQVPPGEHQLVRLVETRMNPGGVGWVHQPLTGVDIQAGETTRIVVGGCTVTARLRWPSELTRDATWTVRATLVPSTPSSAGMPANLGASVAAQAEPAEATAAPRLSSRWYSFLQDPDGLLSADEVPAGDYRLVVVAGERSPAGDIQKRAHAELPVTIPADPSGTCDLGEIELHR